MIKVSEIYKKRKVSFQSLWQHNGWKFKIYTISLKDKPVDPELIEAAKNLASRQIKNLNCLNSVIHYKIGFIIVHEAREADFFLINWWFNENMLSTHTFSSKKYDLDSLKYLNPFGGGTCVWEMSIQFFERTEWKNNVLVYGSINNFDNYLNAYMDDWI